MKLNAAAEMIPLTWFEFSKIHPFAPADQIEVLFFVFCFILFLFYFQFFFFVLLLLCFVCFFFFFVSHNKHFQGYLRLFSDMETMLATLTGFTGCTLQPNAGSQG